MAKKLELKIKKNRAKKPLPPAVKAKAGTATSKKSKIQSPAISKTERKSPSKRKAAQKPPRNSKAKRPTPEEKLKILERRILVTDLRRSGASIRQIAKHLDCSTGTVFSDLEAGLALLDETLVKNTELLAAAELDRIDDWEFTIYPKFKGTKGYTPTIEELDRLLGKLIALQNQRDKYLRVTKPKEIKLTTKAELARALGLDEEELPDDGSSGKE